MKPRFFQTFALFFFLICATSIWSQADSVFMPNQRLEIDASLLAPFYYRLGRAEVLLRYSFSVKENKTKAIRLGGSPTYRYWESTFVSNTVAQLGETRRSQYFSENTGWQVALGWEVQRFRFKNRLRTNTGFDLFGGAQTGKGVTRSDIAYTDGTPTQTEVSHRIYKKQVYGFRPLFGLAYFPLKWLSVGIEANLTLQIEHNSSKRVADPTPPSSLFTTTSYHIKGDLPRLFYVGLHF